MMLCFELSMPNRGSWNGAWTGDDHCYAQLVSLGRGRKAAEHAAALLAKGCWRYDFGDGWTAGIKVREVSGREITKIRRRSRGFCGYGWMVDSIIRRGEILNSAERKEAEAAQP